MPIITYHPSCLEKSSRFVEREKMIDLNRTFVTSDHHFRYWKHPFHLHCESTEEEEREHIALWNSIVGKDDLVFYIGDFCDGTDHDLQEIRSQLNGRMILIKGNHDKNSDEAYRQAFEDVLEEKRIDELNLRLIHVKDKVEELRPGERLIYGHEHRGIYLRPATTSDSICVCAKWHGWKPLTLAEAIRQMDVSARSVE